MYVEVKYAPSEPPIFQHATRDGALARPYVPCWINSQGVAVALSTRGNHLRKGALTTIRTHMLDGSTHTENHHTRFYIWDSSLPWNPHNLNVWTPVAERPRDQWVPSR